MRRQLCTAIVVSLFSTNVWSANQSTMKIDEASAQKNKVEGDLDQEITNAKLRAESGSKSKFSGSMTANYKGGSVSRPFGIERPDLSGLPDNQVDTSLDGTLRLRYRSDKNTSYSLGTSLGAKTPFHGDVNSSESQINVGDPLLARNKTWASSEFQNSWNLYLAAGTSDESQNVDRVGGLSTDYVLMRKIGRLSYGGAAGLWYDLYSSAPGASSNQTLKQRAGMEKVDRRVDVGLTISPTVEYALNDMFTLRALFAYFRWKHLYGDGDNYRLLRIKEYNSVGVGIALMRDVYLYPNVQFLPRDAKLANTNVGLSATINIF